MGELEPSLDVARPQPPAGLQGREAMDGRPGDLGPGAVGVIHPRAEQLPGIVVYRWEAPLFFANDVELNAADIHLAFAELRDRLRDLTRRYGMMDSVDRDHFYPTLEAALGAIEADRRLQREDWS